MTCICKIFHGVRTLLNFVVDEIWWEESLSPYNHNPNFPYFVTHFTDIMPIWSVGGDLSDVPFDRKYTNNIYKVTVAVDNLGNIVWICNLMPGTAANVVIWDQPGPSGTHGQFFDFQTSAQDADNPPLPQPRKEMHPCTIKAMDIIILLLVVTQSFRTNIRYNGVT